MNPELTALTMITAHAESDLYNAYNNNNQDEIIAINNDFQLAILLIIDTYPADKLLEDYGSILGASERIHNKTIELLKSVKA